MMYDKVIEIDPKNKGYFISKGMLIKYIISWFT